MCNIIKFIATFIWSTIYCFSQTTPYGEVVEIRKRNVGWRTGADIVGLVAYRTNILCIPIQPGNSTDFGFIRDDQIVYSGLNLPNGLQLSYVGLFKNNPIIIFGENTISFCPNENNWFSTKISEQIIDVEIDDESVCFLAKNAVDNSLHLIRSQNLKYFERFKTDLIDTNLISSAKLFKIDNNFFISTGSLSRQIIKTTNLKDFQPVKTGLTNIYDAFQFKNVILYTINDTKTFVTDKTLSNSTPLGVYSNNNSFVVINENLFSFSYAYSLINYTLDGLNWSSFKIGSAWRNIEINQICASGNYLYFAGDRDNIYKIGPITSSKPLSVESELIHAIKITGNIGQQVEILASDELNGEYKPLTYFTLPSTEYIYNDNRTNKAKQYYKVR
ncbi:MAG: hypothetical protein FJX80_07560 [Bacteroidetes bacterium]|nr:hypothetical protein [Bacteroidota bacterium]